MRNFTEKQYEIRKYNNKWSRYTKRRFNFLIEDTKLYLLVSILQEAGQGLVGARLSYELEENADSDEGYAVRLVVSGRLELDDQESAKYLLQLEKDKQTITEIEERNPGLTVRGDGWNVH